MFLLLELYLVAAFICAVMVFCACVTSARVTEQELRLVLLKHRHKTMGTLQNRGKRQASLLDGAGA